MTQREENAERMVNTLSAEGGQEYNQIILATGADNLEKVKALLSRARQTWCTDDELGRKGGVGDHLARSAVRFFACDCLRWLIQSRFYPLVQGADASRAGDLMRVCLGDEFGPAARVVEDELLQNANAKERGAWQTEMNNMVDEMLPKLAEQGYVERLDWIARSLSTEVAVNLAKNVAVEPFLSAMPALKAIAEAHEIRGEIDRSSRSQRVAAVRTANPESNRSLSKRL